MNIYVQILVWPDVFLSVGDIPKRITGSYGSSLFIYHLRSYQTVFKVAAPFYWCKFLKGKYVNLECKFHAYLHQDSQYTVVFVFTKIFIVHLSF